jgi:hypothetical protein
MLCPGWFVMLKVLQNADYVLTMHGTALPVPAALSAASETPVKSASMHAKGQQQQQQQLRQ